MKKMNRLNFFYEKISNNYVFTSFKIHNPLSELFFQSNQYAIEP